MAQNGAKWEVEGVGKVGGGGRAKAKTTAHQNVAERPGKARNSKWGCGEGGVVRQGKEDYNNCMDCRYDV